MCGRTTGPSRLELGEAARGRYHLWWLHQSGLEREELAELAAMLWPDDSEKVALSESDSSPESRSPESDVGDSMTSPPTSGMMAAPLA